MAKRLPKAELHRFMFQATYKPNLNFYNLIYSATQKIKGYDHWETNALYVFLHDYKKHCTLAVRHNIIGYEWDYSGTDNYIEDVEEALEILPSSLEIEAFTGLKFRQQFLIPTDMTFEEVNNILNLKFFVQNDSINGLFPSGANDMTYVIVGSDQEVQVRVTVGPMRQEEISNYIKPTRKYNFDPNKPGDYANVLSSYPEVSFYIDIDVFRQDDDTGIPVDYAFKFLETAHEMVQNKLTSLIEYIFER